MAHRKAGPPTRRPNPATMIAVPRKGAESIEETVGDLVAEGICSNVLATVDFSRRLGKQLDLGACVEKICDACAKVARDNDLSGLEMMLTAQAINLNAMSTHLAAQASQTPTLDNYERYLRLALKAQSQSRATVESLAFIKNPGSAVFAKQANIAHGPQQVNNGTMPAAGDDRARAGNLESQKIELLEAHGERVDTGAAGGAGASDSTLAPVGTVHRPAKP